MSDKEKSKKPVSKPVKIKPPDNTIEKAQKSVIKKGTSKK